MITDRNRITYNEILNRIFAGYIVNPVDVYEFVADFDHTMEVGEVAEIIADLHKHGKI